MLDSYLTVKLEGRDELTIQKSRFIGYVKRVETEEAAQSFIQEIKKKHHDATHNCSAYLVGEHDQIQKANDDGEPSGTAGVPILEVLKKQHLKDTVVVVTRYFGGIKLGAGGLIRAYGSTTSQAIKTTGVVKRQRMQGFSVTVDYTQSGKLEHEIRRSKYRLEGINYSDKVEFVVFVEIGQEEEFKETIVDLTSDQAVMTPTNTIYMEIDMN
ncbi:MAG: YigZ family protein [Bacillota bacterium]|uniref:YigZ family protein n=1 Tax=Virgibacillus salarius TaxID=447199 RepID=A0A941DY79_9BACI|nr:MULTISPECIES: YigZ family protein [Bacillaceae]NAZ10581.1 YigZ family protein [Agaribacter marinus]MBR7797871.1 YigZ family protein [Virgibacillus salarius]MCC2251036.1 YigZ family protein [Virgibacillus sp. AGTR]QRZ18049.1 YigZ family protein [Virgibacillus sp. AGTR]WBX78632.1 YigZ family protein [Virgibacillus salarius]